MYQTKITSQGTISIPAALRKKYQLSPGEVVTLEDNGKISIIKPVGFSSIRIKNKVSTPPASVKTGDGISAHVQEKYGS